MLCLKVIATFADRLGSSSLLDGLSMCKRDSDDLFSTRVV